MCSIIRKILSQDDQLSIEQGQLVIRPESGKAIPPKWREEHVSEICTEILSATGLTAFRYESYTVGHYGPKTTPGVNLQFSNILTGETAYVVFNVILTRSRNTRHGKKGQRLPAKQFRVTEHFAFTKFWRRCDLPLPARLSAFHECMGKLQPVLFTATVKPNNAINKTSIEPLEINHDQIATAFNTEKSPDNCPTNLRQRPDNCPTTSRQALPTRKPAKAIQSGAYNHIEVGELNTGVKGQCNNGSGVKGSNSNAINSPIRPEDQTREQWLTDYDR